MTSSSKHLDILDLILTRCVKNLVLQIFCACPSAKSAFAKPLFPSGETSLKCHHPVPIRNLQFLLSKSSSQSSSFCYGWMMLMISFSLPRSYSDKEGYFCEALMWGRIKAFWLCVRQRLPIRFISQEKIVLQFYPFMYDCTCIWKYRYFFDIFGGFVFCALL